LLNISRKSSAEKTQTFIRREENDSVGLGLVYKDVKDFEMQTVASRRSPYPNVYFLAS
jgi:hypothetical protein